MKKIFACLAGDWVCLNDDPECKMGPYMTPPYIWWEEGAEIWAPHKCEKEHTLYQHNYLNICYKGKDYRINPIFIQVVTTKD